MTVKELLTIVKQKPWIIGIAAGAVFLLCAGFWPEKEAALQPSVIDLKAETAEYKQNLTEDLCRMLGEVKGVGEVRLFLNFESSVAYEYLKEENENTDTGTEDRRRDYSESYLLVEDASGKKSVLAVERKLPRVTGAAVVCEGGNDAVVKMRVTTLLRALLDLSAADISVSPLA